MKITDLFSDILTEIFKYVYYTDSYAILETCKSFRDTIYYIRDIGGKQNTNSLTYFTPPMTRQILSNRVYLDWVLTHKSFYLTSDHSTCAVFFGNLSIIRYIYMLGCEFTKDAWDAAIEIEDLYILKWLHKRNVEIDAVSLYTCIATDNVQVYSFVDSLIEKDVYLLVDLIQTAVRTGKYEISTFLMVKYGLTFNSDILVDSIVGGNLQIVKFIIKRYMTDLSYNITGIAPSSIIAIHTAATFNRLEILKWLRKNNYSWNREILEAARQNNNNKLYDWCINNGCPV